jgi:hypothetical protein
LYAYTLSLSRNLAYLEHDHTIREVVLMLKTCCVCSTNAKKGVASPNITCSRYS